MIPTCPRREGWDSDTYVSPVGRERLNRQGEARKGRNSGELYTVAFYGDEASSWLEVGMTFYLKGFVINIISHVAVTEHL